MSNGARMANKSSTHAGSEQAAEVPCGNVL
jgi:hypothetical protein